MKRLWTIIMVLAMAVAMALPSGAITDGELDHDGHPHVGLMVAIDGTAGWRCSGTLVSETVFVTAGHCTDGAIAVWLWFDAYEADIRGSGYPFAGALTGTAYTHPQYDDAAFYLYDLGIVVLDTPVVLDEYGALPELDELDSMKPGKKSEFTAVGYGLQRINPVFVEASLDRMFATPHLVMINVPGFTGDFSIMLSNNASTGGTCFGDSGGPNFIDDSNVIAGVTSFGLNGNCAGTGGVYRIDRQDDLDFINTFLP